MLKKALYLAKKITKTANDHATVPFKNKRLINHKKHKRTFK